MYIFKFCQNKCTYLNFEWEISNQHLILELDKWIWLSLGNTNTNDYNFIIKPGKLVIREPGLSLFVFCLYTHINYIA